MSTWEVIRAADGRITLSLPDIGGIRLSPDDAERLADALTDRPKYRGAGPLEWSTRFGSTPEGVRSARPEAQFSKTSVVAMLDAAEDAHYRRLHAENAEGGKARAVVASVARVLGVDLSASPGNVWSETNMQRVVDAARRLSDDRQHWETEAANWQREAENTADRADYWKRTAVGEAEMVGDTDALRATIVRQALEITELKESE